MSVNSPTLPFYAKATIILVGIVALFTILNIAQTILVPLVFALIIAIVLHPVVNFLVKHHIYRVLAIVTALLITFLLIAGLALLLYTQASRFSESWPIMVDKISILFNETISWLSEYLDIKPQNIHDWIAKTKTGLINTSGSSIGQTIMNVGSTLVILFLIPVYIFLILFYEPLLLDFMHKLFGADNQSRVSQIIAQTKTVIQRYLIGLLIEAALMAIMEIVTLWFLGIEYAILLGIIGALLNMIPYLGGLVAVGLPMMVALATKESGWYAVYILVIYYIIQLIDNNYIVPKIVASKVKINALFSIIVVIAGNALWGIPGMFLSIPLLAIVKLIFDNIEPLKPWGFLLGDTMPSLLVIKPILKKIRKSS